MRILPTITRGARLALTLTFAATFGHHASATDISLQTAQLEAKGHAAFTVQNDSVRLQFDDPSQGSGLLVHPPTDDSTFDFSHWKYLAVDVENLSPSRQLRLLMQVSSGQPQNKDVHSTDAGIALNPGEKRTLRLPLPHRWMAPPDKVPGIKTLDTEQIPVVSFFVQWPFEGVQRGLVDCRLSHLRTEEEVTPAPRVTAAEYVPFIDAYGQFVHADWPAKVHCADDLTRERAREQAELAAAKRPADWDQYGGYKTGPQLQATGSFRTEKYRGKWYLVDPEGRLFFSQGLDVVSRYNDTLKVLPGHADWFEQLPEGATSYQPTETSLRQKYGRADYADEYFATLGRRLEHWGFNTIGNWSAREIMLAGKTPYTVQLTDYDAKMPRLGGSKLKFYDVFDPAYAAKMKTLVRDRAKVDPVIAKSLGDPMCIGYFIDNELNFGNRGKTMTLVDEVMRSPAGQASKVRLVNELKAKYGTIERLNTAWNSSYKEWEEILEGSEVPTSSGYADDANVFFAEVLDQYFRLARDAVKSEAPQRLYLGCRFISTDAVRPILAEMSQKYQDVLSVNVYAHSAANFPVTSLPDMPMMIGEFHFGVLDRGMFSPSLCQAGVTQQDRATAYTRFMQGVLIHPNFVGAHWFQYRDQPLTGRGDSEAYELGFVDVADTPYRELCEASQEIGEHMYTYRLEGNLTNSMTSRQTEKKE